MSKSVQSSSSEDASSLRKEEKRRKRKETDADKQDTGSESQASKKRKRERLPDEIEINVDLPEPASKKAARKAKKAKATPNPSAAPTNAPSIEPDAKTRQDENEKKAGQRSEYGVWIGNLPWSATKDSLRAFLTENAEITDDQITRVNMPAPNKPPNPNWTTKPLNKGFAYVDFSTQLAMFSVIALTETKMEGRPLLIKNAKSFEGRPEKPKTEDTSEGNKAAKDSKTPSKRVFVGNLAFDVTKDDLLQHFSQCGDIVDIHMATFEDSGKCKGYAWVTFETVEAASSAVKGYIYKEESKKGVDDSEDEGAKKAKKRKWLLNKLMGRELRCEFAEDSTTRYNKRFGKEKKADLDGVHPDRAKHFDEDESRQRSRPQRQHQKREQGQKVDSRTIRSGAAHTNAQRASQAIVESKGTKITFD